MEIDVFTVRLKCSQEKCECKNCVYNDGSEKCLGCIECIEHKQIVPVSGCKRRLKMLTDISELSSI